MAFAKAVLFDLFETLVSEYTNGTRKAPRSNHHNAERLGLEHDAYRKEWGACHERRMTGKFADYKSVMKHIVEQHSKTVNEQVLDAMYEERLVEKAAAFRDNDPDIVVLLGRLKQSGFKLGLISNCTEEEVRAWAECGLSDYFDDVIFSYQVGFAKPDVSIYRLACDRLGTKPEQCVFIGDGGSDELGGASRAGMRAHQAVWYLPLSMRERITGYPKLERPLDALAVV